MQEENPWKTLAARPVYENPWIEVTEFDVINPSGGKGIYGKVHFRNTALAIITLTEDLETHLVGQYRFTLNRYSWEITEGGTPEGSDPLEGAKRELLEETGLIARNWQLLFNMHLSNSVSDEYGYIYLARELSQHAPHPEETEQLVVKRLPFEEVYRMVTDGCITDSMSVAAILKLKLLLDAGELK
ncbi:MAG: NUDIX hydrolase [Chitinophagaceae bacterium]|nr:NUDIX hydrolase [Chitinophagaceae bacterium]